MNSITARDDSIKARMNINAARSDDIKARMTCIGQRSPAVLPRTYTKVYAPVSTPELLSPLQVIQRSLLSSFRAVFDLCELLCCHPGLFWSYASYYVIGPCCFGLLGCNKKGVRVFNYFSNIVVKHAVSSFI